MKDKYSVTAQINLSLMKKRMNILISGDNLLQSRSGEYYDKTKYKHTIFTNKSNYYPRGISIGISYNFNNFIDLFRKNDAGEEVIERAQ